MNAQRDENVLYQSLLEQPRSIRDSWLEMLRAEDRELAERLHTRLEADTSAATITPPVANTNRQALPPFIGQYRVLSRLGEGVMGDV